MTPGGALLVALAVVVAPLVMAMITHWQRQRERELDWARQDVLAERRAERDRVVAQQVEMTAIQAMATSKKLDVIHTLVNSNMTAAMEGELRATVRELAMMREVLRVHEAAGRQPTTETLAAIQSTEARVDELKNLLVDRSEAQQVVDRK